MQKIIMLAMFFVFTALSFGILAHQARADAVYTSYLGAAINGYDPVAYFKDGKPVEGNSAFQLKWHGATWHFKNAENKAAFEKSPETYAPQYGGFCAWAVSQGYTAPTVPEAWDIVDGKLYLNNSVGVKSVWRKERAENIKAANQKWPEIKNK